VKHRDGGGLVARARRQEAAKLFLRLILSRGLLGGLQGLRASLGRDSGCEVGELLRLESEYLIARLRRLERAGRWLARRNQRRHLRAVGVEIADDTGLDAQGILQASDRVLPPQLGVGDQRLIGLAGVRAAIGGLESVVDLLNIVGNVLRLGEELLGALDRRLQWLL
jgi:hypothetical protein